jgi:hypothetical protein
MGPTHIIVPVCKVTIDGDVIKYGQPSHCFLVKLIDNTLKGGLSLKPGNDTFTHSSPTATACQQHQRPPNLIALSFPIWLCEGY